MNDEELGRALGTALAAPGPLYHVDEVAGLQVTDGEVAARMLPDDARMVELYTRPRQRPDLVVQVGSRSLPARGSADPLRHPGPHGSVRRL